MLNLSPKGASSATVASLSLCTGSDSPVRADSSHKRFAELNSLASEGGISPASRMMMSPVTSAQASMTSSLASRITLAGTVVIFFSASSAFSALFSWATPRIAFKVTMSRISSGSKNPDPSNMARPKEMRAAAMRMRIMVSLNCRKKRWRVLFFFFSPSLFAPSLSSLRAASCDVRPAFTSVLRLLRIWALGPECASILFLEVTYAP